MVPTRVTRPSPSERAAAHLGNQQWERARDIYRKMLRQDPANAAAMNGLGVLALERRDETAALRLFRRAVAVRPTFFEAHLNLARVLHHGNQLYEALAAAQTAAALRPDAPEIHRLLHTIYSSGGRPDLALPAIRRAHALDPDHPASLPSLVGVKRSSCDWSDFDQEDDRLRDLAATGHRLNPFTLLYTRADQAEQQACALVWAGAFELPHEQSFPSRPARSGDRLRLGYLSGDFHDHATSYLTAELFELHDRSRFEVYGYSYGPRDDTPIQARIRASFDHFRDLESFSSRDAAKAIHADQIDILIDLKGYTDRARPQILAYRSAPIQVNYLGFPGTMGASFVDYLIADPVTAPPGTEAYCTERLVRLPDGFQPNDSRRAAVGPVPPRDALGLPSAGFVFCALHAAYKITPAIFDIWMRLVQATPGSVIWLLGMNALQEDNLRREALARGVSDDRIVFAPRVPHAEHLARLQAADLMLDTLPVGAFTTASDALWAGLPLLTCLGTTAAGRGGASLVQAAGLPELVTDSLADYEQEAMQLARDPKRLQNLRDRLRQNRSTAPLFDIPRFVRQLEDAYLAMTPRP
ncbi:tetratricopeptide repeat protein [Caulobacter henricii]|nr:tetratricopeptide repeat protein [Caulobacter henricii]